MKTCGTCEFFGPNCGFIRNLDKEARHFAYTFVACADYREKASKSNIDFDFDDEELEDTV